VKTVDSSILRRGFGQYPTGVTIVTCRDALGRPQGVTANSFASVSLDPPLVLWSIARSARSFDHFVAAEHFAIHVLSDRQSTVSTRFARAGEDKFGEVQSSNNAFGVPIIAGCVTVFECRREQVIDAGDHVTLMGRVLQLTGSDGANLHADPQALVFYRGRYAAVMRASDAPDETERLERAKRWMGMEPMSWS
jgi:flavin reductase (DIM6/NTAB) family NADH-FMN oxidoreductase RutF